MALDRHDLQSVAVGASISVSWAIFISLAIFKLTGEPPTDLAPPATWTDYGAMLASGLILAPIIETACLAALFYLLRRIASSVVSALACVAAFCLAHWMHSSWWGLVVLVPGLVLIRPFVVVDDRRRAVLRSGLTHALHNGIVITIVLLA